jgi:hypothetical protein
MAAGTKSEELCPQSRGTSLVQFGNRFVQIGDWRLGDYDGVHFTMTHKANINGKTGQIYRSDGTLHPGHTGWSTWSRPIDNSAPGISFGDRFIQIGNWRICDVDGIHASICTVSGMNAQIFRDDGTLHPNWKRGVHSGEYCCTNRPIQPHHPNAPKIGDRYIQIGKWRFGDIDSYHASVSINGRYGVKTAQVYTQDGSLLPGPRVEYNCFTPNQCDTSYGRECVLRPVLKEYLGSNDWMQLGDAHWPFGKLHTEIAGGIHGKPNWGTLHKNYPFKKNVSI